MFVPRLRCLLIVVALLGVIAAGPTIGSATETENLGVRILPAPGKMKIDAQTDDWDLSGGIFACGDVENAASQYALWFYAMYDHDNLYFLVRWIDPTPMNNHGSTKGDYGFNGDCLQVRVVTAPDVTAADVTSTDPHANDAATARTSHLTCWRDRDGVDVIDVSYGRHFNEGGLKDAKTEGAKQAFTEWPGHKGYTQEIAIPWRLLTKPGVEMKPGSRILLTLEPNFTVGTGGRLTIKDIFKVGVAVDRVFTFQGNGCWGFGTLEARGAVKPAAVRLSDGREFPVRSEHDQLAVDWTGLIKSKLPDGFKPIRLNLPEDGFVSLNIFAPDGSVARQLLNANFLTKGEHEILWDGLTTMSVHKPGNPLPAGDYTWEAIFHTGIGLQLRGWAANSGPAPWIGWGADHGNPQGCAAHGDRVFLGWGGGEGDKPLLASDLSGKILWKNIRGGIASAAPVATDGKTVYAVNTINAYAKRAIYRVDARSGNYTEWSSLKSTDLTMGELWPDDKTPPEQPSGLAAAGGNVYVTFSGRDTVLIVDSKTGKVLKRLTIPRAAAIAAADDKEFFVVSEKSILRVNAESGASKTYLTPALDSPDWISALALDPSGNLYAGIRGSHHFVAMYGTDAKLIRAIGRKEGRALQGRWTPDGMYQIGAISVDGKGSLWVAEDDGTPKRVSVWNTQTGEFQREFFGAASYGATGACVNPVDSNLMVGQGCEWRLDPKTGNSTCLGTITRQGMGSSRFGFGPNGRLYLAVTPGFLHPPFPIYIFERLGDANYKLRSTLREESSTSGKKTKQVIVWSDANDDGQEQPDEVKTYDLELGGWFAGWYMSMTQDLSFYGSMYQVKVTGWTACGAPQYDLAKAVKLPAPSDARIRGGMGAQRGLGSADGKYMLWNAAYGEDHATVDCYEIATGKKAWSYPSNFTGVHGSHRAPGVQVGMIRGGYDICGAAKLPSPVGDIWFLPTNKGEWHILTERGFYLTHLFESDPTKVAYPDQATPGVSLDTCPPGAGEESFGGSITQNKNGSISVQAGHISFWNADLTGLKSIRSIGTGKVALSAADAEQAVAFRSRYLQEASKVKQLIAKRGTPSFTGDLAHDFAASERVTYEKENATACQTALAWDDQNLYLGFQVKDSTPWVNGADAPEVMYTRGDTVDLQFGSNPAAPAGRQHATLGDVRISIGNFKGHPTVMAYRKEAKDKHPMTFNSGVVKDYQMDSVVALKDARVEVKVDAVNKRYTVEAALPLKSLELKPHDGLTIRADVGVTHGDRAGRRTVLRTYWSNQSTGLVSDEVLELEMTPAAWGEVEFKN
ncbi:MAG TPA: PQQ-binding-like beta-propeller repeat protein [Pirellulales bacterium]|jgi:hypothetical protein|nr:PQQ-binding-like beta-propeller repeat protein [Pirellulales bacterium]